MKDLMQRAILRTVVNRAAIFDKIYDLAVAGAPDLGTLYRWAKVDGRFSDADLFWIKTDLNRNFDRVLRVIADDLRP